MASVNLINRLARNLVVPLRSFLLSWTFVADAPQELCAHGSCTVPGYLQVQDLGHWVWVCRDHLPAWVQPLLPTDSPEDRSSLPGGLDQCPECDASTRHLGSSTSLLHDTLTLHRCGQCTRRWVLLIGTGDVGDGHRFAEVIPLVAEALEGTGLAAHVHAGHAALMSISRAVGTPLSDGVLQVAGVEVGPGDDRFGSNAIIVVGQMPRTGIQRLGGQPDQATSYGPPTRRRPANRPPITPTRLPHPEVGTIWQARNTDTPMVVMIDGVRTNIGANRNMVCMVSFRGARADGIGPQDEMEVSRFIQLFQQSLDADAPVLPPPPAGPGASPRVGSTWWHVQTSAPIQVVTVEYDRHNGKEQIHFKDEMEAKDILTAEDFHARYVPFNPEPPGEVGDEFIDGGGKLVIIHELLPLEAKAIIHLKGQPTSKHIVSFQNLRTGYTKINRRSAFERLMDDDL